MLSRKNSLTSLFSLFRRIALPTFLLAAIPSRHRPKLFSFTYTIKPGLVYLFPWQVTPLNSALFKSRSHRLKEKGLFSLKALLTRWSNCKFRPALSPPSRQDSATSLGRHPLTKAVGPFPFQIVGLISSFHSISFSPVKQILIESQPIVKTSQVSPLSCYETWMTFYGRGEV